MKKKTFKVHKIGYIVCILCPAEGVPSEIGYRRMGAKKTRVMGLPVRQDVCSDRFVKKKHWGGVAVRQEGGGAAGTNM